MASIFTFESEIPQVSSPWPIDSIKEASNSHEDNKPTIASTMMPNPQILSRSGINKLEAEPQEGPTEYKLHLLLRQRRNFSSTTTVQKVSGSYLSKSASSRLQSQAETRPPSPAPIWAPSSQSRQNRLQHLTTQLIWRLQQSIPYHSSSKSSLVVPVLPEVDVERSASTGPGPLLPGLEDSGGALYEIGVSDDGAFVGLAKDELEESFLVLRAMAYSIGCTLNILKIVIVGDCQWVDKVQEKTKLVDKLNNEKLWVAEVLVTPNLVSREPVPLDLFPDEEDRSAAMISDGRVNSQTSQAKSDSEQLRISLTGSTTSGKSSLLGTLSTSTLDNGRGKSRLSLLKHRHEIVSGVTSSLAQELFGYQETKSGSKVINYASGNVSSWDDIHHASEEGRLVFVTDSAGHPRYRRTTIRGLVSWAPHWTLCCVAADDEDDSNGKIGATATSSDILGAAGVGVDLSKAHLDLCLKLHLPLVVVITKLDIATKTGLRNTLTKLLSSLKSAGRRPVILSSTLDEKGDADLQAIPKSDEQTVDQAMAAVAQNELHLLAPVVLTSTVTGSGIGRLHALLRRLPMITSTPINPIAASQGIDLPKTLFHIDEVFALPVKPQAIATDRQSSGVIVSGYLRYGKLDVGNYFMIGPYLPGLEESSVARPEVQHSSSFPGSVNRENGVNTPPRAMQRHSPSILMHQASHVESLPRQDYAWQKVQISSLRNLRLPVSNLSAGQVGTVGLMLCVGEDNGNREILAPDLCFRRGMVIVSLPQNPQAEHLSSYRQFSAVFQEAGLPAWPGVLVIVYIASIRTSAKILNVKALEANGDVDENLQYDYDEIGYEGKSHHGPSPPRSPTSFQHTEITFEFLSSPEWIEVGTQVLVTPGGSPSLTGQPEQRDTASAGLDGYVGNITQALR